MLQPQQEAKAAEGSCCHGSNIVAVGADAAVANDLTEQYIATATAADAIAAAAAAVGLPQPV
jgi:hypothetical protein